MAVSKKVASAQEVASGWSEPMGRWRSWEYLLVPLAHPSARRCCSCSPRAQACQSTRTCGFSLLLLQQLQSAAGPDDSAGVTNIWRSLMCLSNSLTSHLIWVPGHAGIDRNEHANALAKAASDLKQQQVAISFATTKGGLIQALHLQVALWRLQGRTLRGNRRSHATLTPWSLSWGAENYQPTAHWPQQPHGCLPSTHW